MTLPEYFQCRTDVLTATARLKDAITSAESTDEELELLADRLITSCKALSGADCHDLTVLDIRETNRIIRETRLLLRTIGRTL